MRFGENRQYTERRTTMNTMTRASDEPEGVQCNYDRDRTVAVTFTDLKLMVQSITLQYLIPFLSKFYQYLRVWILPYRSSTPCCTHVRSREGCSLGPHVLPYIESTTIRARAVNKCCLNLTLLWFLQ